MTLGIPLRAAALLIAIAAVIDPAVTMTASAPLPVAVRGTRDTSAARVQEIRARLSSALKKSVNLDPVERPVVAVLVGDRPDADSIPDDVPVSAVGSALPSTRSVRIVSAPDPQPVLPGWNATVNAVVEGTGVAGSTTDIVLEQNGIELRKLSHKWIDENERFTAVFTVPLPEAGVSVVSVRARPIEDTTPVDDAVDVRAVAEARVLKVAVFDPRPSWASAFVRRVLEVDPMFDVSTIVKPSRGLEVRAGNPPAGFTASALERFDLVAIGAPEELSAREVEALRAFARDRGGAVLLLADRRPSGPFVELVGSPGFDEVLLDKPVDLEVPAGSRLRASEFALLKQPEVSTVIAAVQQGAGSRPAIVSIPNGSGQIIFSGVLDAWRFRATEDDAYAAFWRRLVAVAAVASPRRLEVSVHPGVAPVGAPVTVHVEVRRTEFTRDADRVAIPRVSASVIAGDGSATAVRLWPTAEAGVFEGRFEAGAPGQFDVRASLDGRATADTPLVIRSGLRLLQGRDDDARRMVAGATGGVAASASDLRPLEAYLSNLPRPSLTASVHVMRSPWWMIAFVALVCAEWTLRRRQGHR